MTCIALWLAVGVHVWAFASCSLTCPDGKICSDVETCCKTHHGYSCCPYPNAVCCSDLAHCCPSGFRCNLLTQMCEKEGMKVPMVKKEEPAVQKEEASSPPLPVSLPEESQTSVEKATVYCDSYTYCPGGTTCCRYPTGHWWCCPYSPGRCCLDGYHCCQLGYDCDSTFRYCVRRGLMYPFTPKLSEASFPATVISQSQDKDTHQQTPMTALTESSPADADAELIRCDNQFFCQKGNSCCKGPDSKWSCCSHQLGVCCADGRHCCAYGYTCDATSMSCSKP